MTQVQCDESFEIETTQAFDLSEDEISGIEDAFEKEVIPEIEENEKIMAKSYEMMINDNSPFI